MPAPVIVNGLRLPDELAEAIRSGRWVMPDQQSRIEEIFPEAKLVDPMLYGFDMIELENRNWPAETLYAYLGSEDADHCPGTIDPKLSILIGDFGPDRPIALDYRRSRDNPVVVYIVDKWVDGVFRSFWVEAAPEFGTLLRRLCPE